jgi:hypothetical protein
MHSSDAFTYWFFGIAFVVVVMIVSQIQARKRTDALRTVAQEIGFTFEGGNWSDQAQALQLGTALFDRGGGRQFKNIMIGASAGFKASLFDYSYTVRGVKRSHTYTQTVAAFSQDLWIPLFEMRPEGFLDRVGDAFVHKDIDFESHRDFSRRYLLRGPDESRIRKLFSPGLLTFLEELPRDNEWHIEGADSTLFVYRSEVKVGADEFPTFLQETSSIVKTFFSSPAGLSKPAR